MWIPREQPGNQTKEMKIADSVLLSLSMRDNEKCNISHDPSTDLGYELESLIPKDQKIYNNTVMKSGRLLRPPHST